MLTSDKIADGDHDPPHSYGGTETFLLTTINAKRDPNAKRGDMSASGEVEGSPGKSSVESLIRAGASRGLGGIRIDTEVNVVNSGGFLEFGFKNASRKEKKDMV